MNRGPRKGEPTKRHMHTQHTRGEEGRGQKEARRRKAWNAEQKKKKKKKRRRGDKRRRGRTELDNYQC